MKIHLPTICLALMGFVGQGNAHQFLISFKVEDDFGKPVTNVAVGVAVFDHWLLGKDFGEDVFKNINVLTDTDGMALVEGETSRPDIRYGIKPESGYYNTTPCEYSFQTAQDGKWLPWNPKLNIIFKPVVNPVPVLARSVGGRVAGEKIPVAGNSIGFDLIIGDWVSPFGKGESPDFLFQFDNIIRLTNSPITYFDGNGTVIKDLYDNRLALHFSNDGDGIQNFQAVACDLKSPRLAPPEGYKSTLSKREWLEVSTNQFNQVFVQCHSDYDKEANYFFRVRTKKDAAGNITNALYGKIYGDFSANLGRGKIKFTYYLNPEPNSRNMEFNPKKNLLKNLKPMERVVAP